MKATEFCYWLQGAFEIGEVGALTQPMLSCIRKHLDLVKAVPQASEPAGCVEFCNWLRGGVDFIGHEDINQTETVRKRLSDLFVHVIDKLYKNPAALNAIHGPGMRC